MGSVAKPLGPRKTCLDPTGPRKIIDLQSAAKSGIPVGVDHMTAQEIEAGIIVTPLGDSDGENWIL